VRVVAPELCDELRQRAAACSRLTLVERPYECGDVDRAHLVFVATDIRAVNARAATDARARGCFVNVADVPDEGHFVTPAVHRAGPLVVAVSAGGVPAAAARIRDAIADRFDSRFASAIDALGALRRRLLDGDQKERWHAVEADVIDESFCARIEGRTWAAQLAQWESAPVADSAGSTWP